MNPRVVSVEPSTDYKLILTFDNDEVKVFNMVWIPTHKDGDIIVVAGKLLQPQTKRQRKKTVMKNRLNENTY